MTSLPFRLPPNVYFSEEPQIVIWDTRRKVWSTDGFSEQQYDEGEWRHVTRHHFLLSTPWLLLSLALITDERTFRFKTRFFGTMALVQDKHINMPFQSWEMRPRAPNHVVLTIIAAIIEVEFEIRVRHCDVIMTSVRIVRTFYVCVFRTTKWCWQCLMTDRNSNISSRKKCPWLSL